MSIRTWLGLTKEDVAMTEPETPLPAVSDTAREHPVAAEPADVKPGTEVTAETTTVIAPRAEDVMKPASPPPVIELSRENLLAMIESKQTAVDAAERNRDDARKNLDGFQALYEQHAGELLALKRIVEMDGKLVLTLIGQ